MPLPCQFDGFLAGDVLDVHAEDVHAGESMFDFFLKGNVVAGVVAVAEQPCCCQPFVLVVDDMDFSEGDDASEIGGVFRRLYVVLAGDAERGLVAGADGVDLMSFAGGTTYKTNANVNGGKNVDISDIVAIINYIAGN